MAAKIETKNWKSGSEAPLNEFQDVESKTDNAANESVQAQLVAAAVQQLSERMSTVSMKVEEMELRGKAEASAQDGGQTTGATWDALTGDQLLKKLAELEYVEHFSDRQDVALSHEHLTLELRRKKGRQQVRTKRRLVLPLPAAQGLPELSKRALANGTDLGAEIFQKRVCKKLLIRGHSQRASVQAVLIHWLACLHHKSQATTGRLVCITSPKPPLAGLSASRVPSHHWDALVMLCCAGIPPMS
ncbi:hypothetical protein CYMTET_36269 [Cymbomonas tetramitiformis]|uniref:Uncharacterized protein n=1 Tax=Cymbomonas tetramitiformis TaxID=36881 RepID=A0AAE0CGA6_9CHLO|nr:hypothetical protein CYMTET_36269 [Cymbomonas tetramitiformis]